MSSSSSASNGCILGFHSRDQQPCFLTETKKRICIKTEFNSRRINWGSNMAVVSLFRGSNMAAVTSGENQELIVMSATV